MLRKSYFVFLGMFFVGSAFADALLSVEAATSLAQELRTTGIFGLPVNQAVGAMTVNPTQRYRRTYVYAIRLGAADQNHNLQCVEGYQAVNGLERFEVRWDAFRHAKGDLRTSRVVFRIVDQGGSVARPTLLLLEGKAATRQAAEVRADRFFGEALRWIENRGPATQVQVRAEEAQPNLGLPPSHAPKVVLSLNWVNVQPRADLMVSATGYRTPVLQGNAVVPNSYSTIITEIAATLAPHPTPAAPR